MLRWSVNEQLESAVWCINTWYTWVVEYDSTMWDIHREPGWSAGYYVRKILNPKALKLMPSLLMAHSFVRNAVLRCVSLLLLSNSPNHRGRIRSLGFG